MSVLDVGRMFKGLQWWIFFFQRKQNPVKAFKRLLRDDGTRKWFLQAGMLLVPIDSITQLPFGCLGEGWQPLDVVKAPWVLQGSPWIEPVVAHLDATQNLAGSRSCFSSQCLTSFPLDTNVNIGFSLVEWMCQRGD